jgi:CheY-like chemotaxis protein
MLLERRKFATKKPFKEIGHLFYDKAIEEGIELKIHFGESLPRFFVGDIVRIKQIAANFLSNALKFTSKGGEILMSVDYDETKENLHFSVKDSGVGIDEKNLKKIFESFTQEDTTTTRKFGGTGLGLSISKALINSMDGYITVESVLGEGSTFHFFIPLIEADVIQNAKEISVEKVDLNRTLKGRVLLVEDNQTNQMLMNIILGDLELDVDLAQNGLEAVEQFKLNKYDLILMDENMPKMSGIEATKIILDLEIENGVKHTPIIALTANALATDRARFLNAGMDEFVSKPIDHELFVRVLHSFLL